jgi:hypothetical protein
MGFNLVNLAITVRTDDVSLLCKSLPQLGKEYASVCRSLSCYWPERVCEVCSKQYSCGWYLVFGQKLSSDQAALKRHQKPPLPFVFSFPVLELFSESHKDIVCGLVVIGPAISHLEMLLSGLREILLSGLSQVPAEIIQISCRDFQGSVQFSDTDVSSQRTVSMVPANLIIVSTEGLLESRVWNSSKINIRLLSPLRLLDAGHLIFRFEFGRFARSVMRRVSSLASYYGESEFDCDFKELSNQVDDVRCTDDHFGYSEFKDKKKAGLVGYGSFSGDFCRLLPLLVIGSYVHTGKGSSFGMGAYEVIPDDVL